MSATGEHRGPATPEHADGFAPEDGDAVPGLGFDYPHFAAVHPTANHRHLNANGLLFFGGGPFYVEEPTPPSPSKENSQEEQSLQTIQETREAGQATREAPVRTTGSDNLYPAPGQVAEYLFVRNDGTVFFAVAYSWQNTDLQYVTGDGLRRTVPRSSLDLGATQQFNDQRGVSFHPPPEPSTTSLPHVTQSNGTPVPELLGLFRSCASVPA